MKYLLLLFVLLSMGCRERSARSEENALLVEWELRENRMDDEDKWLSVFRLVNRTPQPLSSSWELFFNHSPGRLVDTLASEEYGYEMRHWAGDLYSITPIDKSLRLEVGDTLDIPLIANGTIIKNSDAPAGIYLVIDGNDERVIYPEYHPIPIGKDVTLFKGRTQVIPDTPEERYRTYASLEVLQKDELSPITPEPVSWKLRKESMVLNDEVKIWGAFALKNEIDHLKEFFQNSFRLKVNEITEEGQKTDGIGLFLDPSLGEEEYHLDIGKSGGKISGGSRAAVFYGITSLKSLILKKDGYLELQGALIHDFPAHNYRGMHLDVARNFSEEEAVLELLDQMGRLKLNTFHFHLTDDEGWRIEIPGLEELTRVGAVRQHTRDEINGLHHQYGSATTTSGSGYYSREAYIRILKYAAERHIEVIPEIDLPGHARAAIVAMKAREKTLLSLGEEEKAREFLLHDPEDNSSYLSVQNYDDNVVNVCMPSLYTFVEKVVSELEAMHRESGTPLKTLHIGGDEVPVGVWEQSAACLNLFPGQEDVVNLAKLYFINNVSKILERKNIRMAGWEEIGLLHEEGVKKINTALATLNPPLLYHWHNASTEGSRLGEELAEAGYPVILSHVTHLYFDMAYSSHPEDRGFYWGGFVDTRRVFNFEFLPSFHKVEGIQGQLWSELIHDKAALQYAIYPKLFALGERAWKGNPRAEKDVAWNRFANRLVQWELPRLDEDEIAYRIPPPGGFIKNDSLYLNTAFPGMDIRYLEADKTDMAATYSGPVPVKGKVRAITVNRFGRSSRPVVIEEVSKGFKD
ncbi:hypothetical protein E7Z59_01145 [Robertkochia marina]|uniref:beta-N-acetylhexosaminidase n=1 Tax=Robertkochia marina TaxID=1227945 RepID=A0A4V3UYA9_9FLAO|nr:family 20 glycosylhydrolase [Robertkochia marina]THD68968.1 hypothetical protein E7Z59_01145 [Robertkochia marina]TRZ44788.1 hypothetical protein D3A96_07100 [Robertkochia marina]